MNKAMKMMTTALLAAAIMVPSAASAAEMGMGTMDMGKGTGLDYSKVKVVMKDGHTLVPLRQVAESLGYSVNWSKMSIMLAKHAAMGMETEKGMMDVQPKDDSSSGMTDMTYSVTLMMGSKDIMVGKDKKMLTYGPVLIQGKTYVTKEFVNSFLLMQ